MIKINCNKDNIVISGHANYDNYGNDIVCASVSAIVYTTVNCLLNIDNNSIKFTDTKNMNIDILIHNEINDKIIDNMICLLEDLEKQYPKNIKLCKGE